MANRKSYGALKVAQLNSFGIAVIFFCCQMPNEKCQMMNDKFFFSLQRAIWFARHELRRSSRRLSV
ncbi:MAG: hypothetical protein QOF62_989 [Pyrinomonadaceae bacterium]|jgi:hypothetical protein|nr:hypothetical protein [Pyrinomonadaceae bacterium]